MKKLIPILIILTLALSGCGLTEQAKTVNEKYIAPALAEANGESVSGGEFAAGPNVKADWSALSAWVAPETVGSRGGDQRITEFVPSGSYGFVTPFRGERLSDDSGELRSGLYGLVTGGGQVVLDPILTDCWSAVWYGAGGSANYLPVYVAETLAEDETAEGGYAPRYALIAMDGSWATDFLFSRVMATELGCVCVYDGAKNLATCFAADGSAVFDTSSWSRLGELAPGSIETLGSSGSAMMSINYANGQKGFMDKNGTVLNRAGDLPSFFDDARGFSEGLAAVCNYGQWGYLALDGSFAVERQYSYAGDFMNGIAVVKKDGVYQAINPSGETVKQFAAGDEVVNEGGYLKVTTAAQAEKYYLSPSMNEANIYDKELHMASYGYWVQGDTGVRLREYSGAEHYFSGAVSCDGWSGGGLWLVTLADGTMAAADADGRVVLTGSTLELYTDVFTGEVYLYDTESDLGEMKVYDAKGAFVADGVTQLGSAGGLFLCGDSYTTGVKNLQNQWVLRLRTAAID